MPEVVLRPMTAEEFATYRPWAQAEYADELRRNTGISTEAATGHAEDSFGDLTPDGVLTPGHQLLVAEDAATGERVGLLWLTVRNARGAPAMWIYDIYVQESVRGKGYGRRLLGLAEEEARRAGVDRMELNVAGDNDGARAVYERMGYVEMSRQMYKPLADEVADARAMKVRPLLDGDRAWAEERLRASWGSTTSVSRGRVYDALELPGLVGLIDGERAGLVTYAVEGHECEVVTLDAFRPRLGVGSALLAAAIHAAREAGCARVWLITTNDNLDALRFYQRRGMTLVAVHAGAVEESRRLKPNIPLIGRHGIPIRDELELEIRLDAPAVG